MMNRFPALKSPLRTASHFLLSLVLYLSFGAPTTEGQTILNDADAVTDLGTVAGSSASDYPGTVESPLSYVIGASAAYDTDMDNGIDIELYDYTTFTVQNGSTVEYSAGGIKAKFSGSNSSIIVTGANSQLILEDATNLYGLRADGTNSIQILAGGSIETGVLAVTSGTLSLEIDGTNSTLQTLREIRMWAGNSVTVDIANGGRWNTTNFSDADGTLTLNLNDGGTLQTSAAFNVSNIDTFNFNSGASLVANAAVSNLGTISSGRTVDISGGGSFATATILDGGTLSTGDFALTNLSFTSGTMEASGTLTNLSELVSGHNVDITSGGSFGDATTLNGGTLTTGAFDLTNLTFTSGTLAASGALTNLPTLVSEHNVDLTSGGSLGDATTLNGGAVDAAAFDATNLTFTSGTLTATGAITNLNTTGAGQTVILDGGTWSPTGNIDDGNTTIQNDGALSVIGDFDGTNLTFTAGTLTVAGDASNLPVISSGRTVELTGNGTLLTSGTLNGGTLTGGDFDLNGNLTFTSGTLNVTGTLQNLTHLPSGTAVNMSGASADLILSQDLVITGGTLNVDDGASVTVLNDVTLGAGSIGFDSNGGNLDLGGGKLIVAAMDTALALNANASITGNGSIYGDVNLGTGGTIDGDATGITIFGDVSGTGTLADTTLYGALNVGNSPGEISLENTTLGSSTVINLAIEGADSSEFDRLLVDATSDVSAATINITFAGYTPASMGLTYSLVSNSSSTSFATINTPDGWAFNGTTLSAVPEPTTFALLASLLVIGFTATRRRAKK